MCQRSGYQIKRIATEHAGGKWRLNYTSVVQPTGNLEIDLSYLYRETLWPTELKDSCWIGQRHQATQIPLLDLHELAAGKIAALMSRHASRDLYDTHQLLVADLTCRRILDIERLKLAFIIYGGMNRRDWRTLKIEDIKFDPKELQNKLLPVLNQKNLKQSNWIELLVSESQNALSKLVSFAENEKKFLDLLLNEGKIEPSLITTNFQLQQKIARHPRLLWKAENITVIGAEGLPI